MLTITSPAEMRAWTSARHREGRSVGFVPTMGALHDGHLALVAGARSRCDEVVVSIFVNPLQFNVDADFDSYPRPIDDDVAACADAGVAAVYAPTAGTMYPDGFQTRVVPGALAEVMEGPMRPGHFEGVTTVVTKLFGAVQPDIAVFGEKDFQQLTVLRRMAADLDTGIDIVGHPIVRDADGVAKSSRNVRLDPAQRAAAVCIPAALERAAALAVAGDDVASIIDAVRSHLATEPLASVEYVTVFDAESLTELDTLTDEQRLPGRSRLAVAVWFGDVRLIDNRDLFAD